jgi:myosin heavy subunit
MQRILGEQASAAHRDSLLNLEQEIKLRTERLAVGQAEAAQLQADIAALQKKEGAQDEIADKQAKLAQKQKELNELSQAKNADLESLAAEATTTDEIIERKQEYLNLLKQQETLMQSLESLSQQQGMESAGARLDAQVEALNGQLEVMERAHKTLVERGGEDDRKTAEDLRKQIAEHEARRAALDSPQARALADLYDHRRIASRRASEESQSYGVGYTEADKLLNEERQLQQRLAALRNKNAAGTLSDNDAVRAKELEIQLWNTQERIQTRIVELARQERQIRLDAAREFNKGLLLAAPGELLQRLHVSELMRRPGGISPGEFMSMSSENRRLYYDAMGGEPGAMNRREISRLRGHHWTTEQEQAAQNRARGAVSEWDRILSRNARNTLTGLPPTTPLPLDARARLVSENLGNLAQVAAVTTSALGRMSQAMDQFTRRVSGGHVAAASGPQLNLSAGYSLGARS